MMRTKTGGDAQGNGRRCASGRETTAVVCKKHRSGFVKPPRWFSQTTALLSRFAYEPSPSSLSPLPVPLGLSARFVDDAPSRSCASRLPRLPTCGRRHAHHRRPVFASRSAAHRGGFVSRNGFQAASRKTGQPKSPDGAGDCKTSDAPAPEPCFAAKRRCPVREFCQTSLRRCPLGFNWRSI